MRHIVSVRLGLSLLSSRKTIVVTLANGSAGAGYVYADRAYSHLTFQVIGSRLKPGCAEGKIVATALELMRDGWSMTRRSPGAGPHRFSWA